MVRRSFVCNPYTHRLRLHSLVHGGQQGIRQGGEVGHIARDLRKAGQYPLRVVLAAIEAQVDEVPRAAAAPKIVSLLTPLLTPTW